MRIRRIKQGAWDMSILCGSMVQTCSNYLSANTCFQKVLIEEKGAFNSTITPRRTTRSDLRRYGDMPPLRALAPMTRRGSTQTAWTLDHRSGPDWTPWALVQKSNQSGTDPGSSQTGLSSGCPRKDQLTRVNGCER